jgi:large subunit ribosomal protein L3
MAFAAGRVVTMNESLGLIGRKLGMTQIHDENGMIHRVTAVEAGPCVIVSKRTVDKDGYTALQLGFGEIPERLVKLPVRGQFNRAGLEPRRLLKELRVTEEVASKYNVGDELTAEEVFKDGDLVDVVGTSKGRGFSGVMRRHHFAGAVATHGSHEYKRHGGAIGQNMTPGRVFKGVKMAGQHGDRRVTQPNLHVVRVVPEKNVVLLSGAIPGARNGFVVVRGARKRKTTSA